ncbi:hypothetical protein E4U58_000542 [Claviceps cyperi]|nr:hypothetical protein E4U58_000542 [Claviceps cyperi]
MVDEVRHRGRLLDADVHDLALATVSNDRQDLGEVAAEDDRDTAKENVVVRAAQVDQQTVDGLETVLVLYQHLVLDDEVGRGEEPTSRALLGYVVDELRVEVDRQHELGTGRTPAG